MTTAGRVAAGLLTLAVALAFADASIVVLALPPIYGELGTSVVGTSWIITSYAVAVTVVGAILLLLHRRLPALGLTVLGLTGFTIGSLGCGRADTTDALVTGRVVQGVGAALLLSGAMGMLTWLLGAERGVRTWATAAVAGLAVGPALGGALTEAVEWRAIFLAQAPVAALAIVPLLVTRHPTPPNSLTDLAAGGEIRAQVRHGWAGPGALVLVSGALVGALFLGVLMIVEIWQHPPLEGAVIVSALPVALLIVRAVTHDLGSAPIRAAAGAVGLAGGLVGLAVLPTSSAGWASLALGVCGAGLGLVEPPLTEVILRGDAPIRTAALDVTARHAGLVLGLLLIAPVLSADLEAASDTAVLAGAETVMDARLTVATKLDVARGMGTVIDEAEPGRMPDVAAAFAAADGEPADLAPATDALVTRVEEVLTRSFRSSFLIAAALALLALVPALLATYRFGTGTRHAAVLVGVCGAVVVAAVALPIAGWRAGGEDVGEYVEPDPCTEGPDPYSGEGLDTTLQRIAFGALNGAACDLGISRVQLVLQLAEAPGFQPLDLTDDQLEKALEAGLLRATDDAEDRGHLPGLAARVIRGAARIAPLTLILDGIEEIDLDRLPFDLPIDLG